MWYNTLMMWLLRSPFHGIIDKDSMLVTVTGKKSGKAYTTPVNYSREQDMLTVISQRDRTWWRNLRGGRPVKIHLRGQDLSALGTAVEDDAGVTANLTTYLQKNPQLVKYFSVTLDSNGQPKTEEVAQSAKNRVIVQIKLGESA